MAYRSHPMVRAEPEPESVPPPSKSLLRVVKGNIGNLASYLSAAELVNFCLVSRAIKLGLPSHLQSDIKNFAKCWAMLADHIFPKDIGITRRDTYDQLFEKMHRYLDRFSPPGPIDSRLITYKEVVICKFLTTICWKPIKTEFSTTYRIPPWSLDLRSTHYRSNPTLRRKMAEAFEQEMRTPRVYNPSIKHIAMGIHRLPTQLCSFPGLRTLNLDSNNLSRLPAAIGKIISLRELSLCDNGLTTLPPSFIGLINLTTLRLRHNKFEDMPPEAKYLKKRHKLKYIEMKGNPSENKLSCVIS
ncbi:MAG: leucine-rich repeat domain-containing protein [Simkaniaceae bacterium]|nr:leucine-rich repeat domain-containing protein [Simkaniaceae bacterium]